MSFSNKINHIYFAARNHFNVAAHYNVVRE
jgi:hypothetical protein